MIAKPQPSTMNDKLPLVIKYPSLGTLGLTLTKLSIQTEIRHQKLHLSPKCKKGKTEQSSIFWRGSGVSVEDLAWVSYSQNAHLNHLKVQYTYNIYTCIHLTATSFVSRNSSASVCHQKNGNLGSRLVRQFKRGE